jgi:hypothetical protein
MKKLVVLLALLGVTSSYADTIKGSTVAEYEYQYSPSVSFVYTDATCVSIGNPDFLPLVEAWTYDKVNDKTVNGCALLYEDKVEFQLVLEEVDSEGKSYTKFIQNIFYQKLFARRTKV